MGKSDAAIRRARWLAAATEQGNLPARLTHADVTKVQARAQAFIESIAANPSLEGARRLDEIAKSAREQAQRDKSEARDYIATAVSLETLSASILDTLKAQGEFIEQLDPQQREHFTR
jgi:hypothetical protein